MKNNKNTQSFVEMEEKDIEEKIINKLDEYKYIEPKKKLPIKKILLVFFSIVAIALAVIFLKIQDSYNTKNNSNNTPNNTSSSSTTKISSTTTTAKENEIITETIHCYVTEIDQKIEVNNTYTANFYEGKLRSDINTMTLKLLEPDFEEDFLNNVTLLKIMLASILSESDAQIEQEETSTTYSFSIKINYDKDKSSINNFNYDESIDSVKQKLLEQNFICN